MKPELYASSDYLWIRVFLDYPETLKVIESTLIMGGFYPPNDKNNMDMVLGAFMKLYEKIDRVVEYAKGLDYKQPWEEMVRLW